ncbi:MAG: DNA primase [Candidatus Doudnabacteria bacterium]|nr:DNA primase [Candidatus Doudnabacteria bacterium]
MQFDSPIQEIKDRLPILEVIQDFVQLKKAGTNYKGICPFHSEKSASFMVSPSKQIWHCFGCGLGGDIFEFVKLTENIEFPEALKILADRAGIELKKPTPEQAQVDRKKDVLYEINLAAAKYFVRVLWESNAGSEALSYLRKRGLSDQTIKNWMLGFAPEDFHYLENHLAKSFDKKDIEQAGLIIKSDRNDGYFDRFHDRVMFPIVNVHGQVVGFTGRLLHDKPNAGKYVNSPETPIYNKSAVIYGLYQGKNAIRKSDRAIVVEGNMDVIACHQVGSQQAVATSGTAMTAEQLLILQRFTNNLTFAFDTDSAGSTATKRALELALNQGFNVKIANLGTAKDPDELIKRGIGLWEKAVEGAGNFIDFFFDQTFKQHNAQTVEGKREITKELAPLIYRSSDPVTKAHYVRKLANGINVAENSIWGIINGLKLPKSVRSAAAASRQKPRPEVLRDQVLGLSLILKNDEYAKDLGLSLPDSPAERELLIFAAEMDMKEQMLEPKNELPKVAMEYKKLVTKERMKKLAEEITLAEQQKNKQLLEQLSQEYVTLSQQVKNFS